MPWNLKSDKTGKVYTFADDVGQDDALDYMDAQEAPAKWGEVMKQAWPEAKRGAASAVAGLRQLAEDVGLADEGQAAAVRKEIQLEREAELPKNMSLTQQGVLGGLASVPEMAVSLLPGVGVASKAMTVGRALKLGLAPAVGMETAREYGEQREAGIAPLRAGGHAAVAGAAEAIGERLPLKYALDTMGEKAFGKFLGGFIGRDLVGEELTYAIQSANAKVSRNPEMTAGEFAEGLYTTAVGATVGSGVVGTGLKATDIGVRAVGQALSEMETRDTLQRFVEMAGQEPLTPVEPMTEEGKTQQAGPDLAAALTRFRAEEIPENIWSEFATKYMLRTGVQQAPEFANHAEAVEWLTTQVAEAPNVAHQTVLANVDQLTKAGVDVSATLGRAVESGVISEEIGRRVLAKTANTLSQVVDGLETARRRVAADYASAEEKFLERVPTATEVGQGRMAAGSPNFLEIARVADTLAQKVEDEVAAAQIPLSSRKPLTYSELRAADIPADLAFEMTRQGVSGEPITAAKQVLTLRQTAQNFRELVGTAPSYSGAERTSPARFGVRTHFIQAPNSFNGSKADGKTVVFGPLRGRQVSDGFLSSDNAGMVNVAASDGTMDVAAVKRVYAITRRWVQKYAPNMQLVILTNRERSYMKRISKDTFILQIDSSTSPKNIVLGLAHEFGHALFIYQYQRASKAVQEAVRLDWVAHLGKNWEKPYREFMSDTFRGGYADYAEGKTLAQAVYRNMATGDLTGQEVEAADYVANFYEWHAGMMEKMLAGDYQGMMKPVEVFWKRAFHKLQQFFTNEHKLWEPNQTIKEFLELMKKRDVLDDIRQREHQQWMQAAQLGLTDVTQVEVAGVTPDAQPELAPISAQNQRQESLPEPAQIDSFIDSVKKVTKVLTKVNKEQGPEVGKSLVRFNEMWAYLLGSFQVLELNKGVPGATRFLNALRAKFGYKSIWLRGANQTANVWEGLGKERAGALAKLLLTEAETDTWFSDWREDPARPGHYEFILDPDKAAEFKIDEETAAVYQQVRDMYMRALDAMEELGRERIVRQFAADPSNPQMGAQLQELEASYANMRDRPYTPFSRFGKFYVKIKARDNGIFKDPVTGTSKFYTAGQTVYFETFETALERDNALPELQKRYGKSPMLDAQFNTGKIHDIVYSVRNLPPQFVRSIADRLDLDADQLREYNEIVKDLAADSSFVKHMKRKANISGYSPDTLRGFADYFLRFSNNYAKGKSAPEFEAAMADVREYKRTLESSEVDTTKLDEFYNWLQRTFNYVMNPGNELAELKSFVTGWYLGFNIPTAVQNITQLPFWTLPYLSKRFGTPAALGALQRAVKDVVGGWKNLKALTDDEKAMLTHALEQGFVDESFATSIAQFAEGTALTRLTATATRHRLMNWYNHKALYMFQLAEEVNRRASLLAAYRLNRGKEFSGTFDAAAFLKARETVEVTQNEYALENRPEFMRGNKSVIFQFMHYVQNAIFRMTPWGDDAWMRFLLMQLSVGGLLGLPFAEDLLNAVKFLARKFGIHVEPEMELRQLVKELGIAPDWVLRGAASHVGPFDLSYRYSLGQVIPGMSAVGSNRRFNDAILEAVGDVGGAGSMIMLNALKAVASLEDPNKLKTAQYVSPSFVKYGLQAMSASEEGGVIARNGALIAPLNEGEILGMGIGLQPRAKSHAYTKIGFESETRNYWMTRRAIILDNMYQAVRTRDREAIADTRKRIKEFNEEVRRVEPKMTINARTVQSSITGRMRAARMQERTGSPYKMPTLQRSIEAAVPQESGEDEAPY